MKKSFLVILARIERKLKPYKGQSCFGPFNFPHLVKVREQGLDHGVLKAELCVPLLAVPGGPGAEHGGGWQTLEISTIIEEDRESCCHLHLGCHHSLRDNQINKYAGLW